MADINAVFIHPTNGGTLSVDLDDEMTAREIKEELISNGFIPQSNEGYKLAVKERNPPVELNDNDTLASVGASGRVTIAISPITLAGTQTTQ